MSWSKASDAVRDNVRARNLTTADIANMAARFKPGDREPDDGTAIVKGVLRSELAGRLAVEMAELATADLLAWYAARPDNYEDMLDAAACDAFWTVVEARHPEADERLWDTWDDAERAGVTFGQHVARVYGAAAAAATV